MPACEARPNGFRIDLPKKIRGSAETKPLALSLPSLYPCAELRPDQLESFGTPRLGRCQGPSEDPARRGRATRYVARRSLRRAGRKMLNRNHSSSPASIARLFRHSVEVPFALAARVNCLYWGVVCHAPLPAADSTPTPGAPRIQFMACFDTVAARICAICCLVCSPK
jgi:hypothetical protein